MTYNRLMKDKLTYLLGAFIGLLLVFAFYYLAWIIFKRISPEQAFFAKTLLDENYFVIAFLMLLVFPIEKIFKSHKHRHQSYLNKLAEIEWLEQYGNDGRVR